LLPLAELIAQKKVRGCFLLVSLRNAQGGSGKLAVLWADAEKGMLQLPTVAVVRDGELHASISREQLFRDCRCHFHPYALTLFYTP
jgi:hypothetical protein